MARVTRVSGGKWARYRLLFRLDMKSYDSVTPTRRPVIRIVLAVTMAVAIFGISVSAAQGLDPSIVSAQASLAPFAGQVELEEQAGPSEEVLDLVAQIEERDHRIAVLEEQLAFVRQAQLSSEVFADERECNRAKRFRMQIDRRRTRQVDTVF